MTIFTSQSLENCPFVTELFIDTAPVTIFFFFLKTNVGEISGIKAGILTVSRLNLSPNTEEWSDLKYMMEEIIT